MYDRTDKYRLSNKKLKPYSREMNDSEARFEYETLLFFSKYNHFVYSYVMLTFLFGNLNKRVFAIK